jgi:PAS domain S-box-containing protein
MRDPESGFKSVLSQKTPFLAKAFSTSVFPNLALSLTTIALLAAIGWFGHAAVEREMKANLSMQLQTLLSAQVASIENWMKDKTRDAEVLASQPEIIAKIISLINIAQKEDVSASVLKQSEELQWLREHLGKACMKYGFVGFVILDSTGYQVGTLLDNALGKRKLIERSDFFYRSLQGDTVVSHPFPGEVDLPDSQGHWQPNRPTMFTSSPIRNAAGQVLGVLAFRFRPEMEFTHMLEVTRFGSTGESYAFNDEGFLLTESRFIGQLKKEGLLAESDASSILKIQLRDPEKTSISQHPAHKQGKHDTSLTLMAASAVKGESGVNLEAYNDYRGTPVVGAWTWLPDHYLGVATEMDAKEAFGPLYTISQGFLAVFGLLIVASLIALLMHLMQLRMQRERNRAQEKVLEREIRIRTLVDYALDGIITLDAQGIIETFNPAAERLFGYHTSEVLNKNISMLLPEPHRSHLRQFLKNFMSQRDMNVLNAPTEAMGLRKNGSVFYLGLSLSNMVFGGSTKFIGILRDITEKKRAEAKLQTQAKQRGAINKLSQIALPGNDVQELMDHAVHLLSRTLLAEYCKILKYIPEERSFLLQAGWGWEKGVVGKAKVPDEMNSQAGYTLRSKIPVVVKDLNRETRFSGSKLLLDHGIISGMSVVIHAGTQVFGILSAHTKEIRNFSPDEVNFLQSMANILGSAIERKNAEDKLERKAKELERSNQELEDFAFIASHDLQEPLRKVMLFGDRIKSVYPDNADDRGLNYIDRLQNSMTKMQGFIHDLLEYSKVTRTSTPLKTVNLEEVVSEAVNNLEAQIKRSQGTIEVLPLPSINGDQFQLGQLFQNLISNALKYSRDNVPPKIKVSSRSNGNFAWEILVEDNGIGIDPKYFHKIFKPFERLHSSDQYGGTGIGLAICSKVLGRHEGNIQIESQPGKGSVFIITLPKIQATPSLAEETQDKLLTK